MKNYVKHFRKLWIILCLIPNISFADSWSAVAGVEHISSLFDGRPFNDNKELSTDFVYAGIRYKHNGWRVDTLLSANLNSIGRSTNCDYVYSTNTSTQEYILDSTHCESEELGSNPRAIVRIEKEWSLSW